MRSEWFLDDWNNNKCQNDEEWCSVSHESPPFRKFISLRSTAIVQQQKVNVFLALMINKHFSLLFVKAFLAAAFYYAERKKLKNGLKPRLSFKWNVAFLKMNVLCSSQLPATAWSKKHSLSQQAENTATNQSAVQWNMTVMQLKQHSLQRELNLFFLEANFDITLLNTVLVVGLNNVHSWPWTCS